MSYYIREGQALNWTKTNALTLGAAKRASAKAQMFQGTDLYVGQEIDWSIFPVAIKRADALNMRISGQWVELDPSLATVGDIQPL